MKSRPAWNRQKKVWPCATLATHAHTHVVLVCFFVLVIFSQMFFTPHVALADECPAGGSHSYSVVIETPATDEEDGVRRFTCTKCGYSFTQIIEATGHHWSEWMVDYPATCTTPGQEWRVCDRYEPHYEYREIPPLSPTGEHEFVETSHRDANCTEDGYTTYTCSICGYSYSDTYLATGHNWGAWETVKEASVTEEGLEQRVCQNNTSHVETRAIPVTQGASTAAPVGSPQNTNADTSAQRSEEVIQDDPETILGLPREFFTKGADTTTGGIVGSGFFLWLLLVFSTSSLLIRSRWAAKQRKAARNDARAANRAGFAGSGGVR